MTVDEIPAGAPEQRQAAILAAAIGGIHEPAFACADMRGSVVHAGGAGMGGQCGAALAQGVKIMACENTMTDTMVTRDDMLPNISCVKAGVVELMVKQQQGWTYIRPWQLVQRVSSLPRKRECRKATHWVSALWFPACAGMTKITRV